MPRVRVAISALAAMTLLLSVPSLAHAARVTSAKPWAASNEYLVEADVDGRTQTKSEPRAKIDWLKKGQWVTIQCQASGDLAYGSRIWDKVGGYYVPDQFLKTYTDGFIKGAPRCEVTPAQTPTTPPAGTTPPAPPPPAAGDPTNIAPLPAPTPAAGCTAKSVRVGPLTATAAASAAKARPTSPAAGCAWRAST